MPKSFITVEADRDPRLGCGAASLKLGIGGD